MDHIKKNNINQKHKKIIKLYICKNREIEINLYKLFNFRENKLST